jgi:hypothetical protein
MRGELAWTPEKNGDSGVCQIVRLRPRQREAPRNLPGEQLLGRARLGYLQSSLSTVSPPWFPPRDTKGSSFRVSILTNPSQKAVQKAKIIGRMAWMNGGLVEILSRPQRFLQAKRSASIDDVARH